MKPSEIYLRITFVLFLDPVNNEYSDWRIGTTQRPDKRPAEWGNPDSWMEWKIDSLEGAEALEAAFQRKGMKGHAGGDMEADKETRIYIFLEAENQS